MEAPQPLDERVRRRIEEWKRRLVDLSRRNRLLFFTPSRTASVRLAEPPAEDVFERFVLRERPWRFWAPLPEPNEEPHDPAQAAARPRFELSTAPERRTNELACHARDPAELVRILKNLHRRSRTDFQERGVRILHVAFGLLRWQEAEYSHWVRSPLVLVPAELVRESARDPFELRPVGEEIVLNPALDVKLRNDFRMELPGPPEDWEEVGLLGYLQSVREYVGRRGWSVEEEAWIGLFSFHKLVIYQDLSANTRAISAHPLVQSLAGAPGDAAVFGGDTPLPEDLDRVLHPKDSFLVVDADSSQLAAIEAVKRGASLVVHGPPGTGKSQTITNVIAETLASGKTVLFVSEKMAALEVVYKRLREARLDHFCLELHSHRANKREAVAELARCLQEELEPKQSLTSEELETLVRRRAQLGEYVHALHVVREPLRRTAFEVLSELSGLRGVPLVAVDLPNVSSLSPSLLGEMGQTASRLQSLWHVALEGDQFPWRGCINQSYSSATRTEYERILANCIGSVGALSELRASIAEATGVGFCASVADCEWLLTMLRLLREPGRPEPSWLTGPDVAPLLARAGHFAELTRRRREAANKLRARYGEAFLGLPSTLREQVAAAHDRVLRLLQPEGAGGSPGLGELEGVHRWAKDLAERVVEWERQGVQTLAHLGLPGEALTTHRLGELVRIVELCGGTDKPDKRWLDAAHCREVGRELPRLSQAYREYRERRDTVQQRYTPKVFDLDLERLIEAFSGRYSSFLRWLMPAFYRDRRSVALCALDGRVPGSVRDDLLLAREVMYRRAELDREAPQVRDLLGSHYRGYDTDFDGAGRARGAAEEIISLARCDPLPEELRYHASADGAVLPAAAAEAARHLRHSIAQMHERAAQLAAVGSVATLPGSGLAVGHAPLADLGGWARQVADATGALKEALEPVRAASDAGLPDTVGELLADLDALAQLRAWESEVNAESARLAEAFGARFCGLETEWTDIVGGLQWAGRVREHFGSRPMSREFVECAVQQCGTLPEDAPLEAALRKAQVDIAALEAKFDRPLALGGVPIREIALPQLIDRVSEMQRRLDEIRDWVDFQALRRDSAELGLSALFDELLLRPVPADLVPKVVRRAALHGWAEYVCEQDPALGGFRGQDHEKLIAEFRRLDRRHWQVGAHRVIAEANKHRPPLDYAPDGSETRLLRHEALKQRRHLPIRKLFDGMPRLITRLKPCLLMSPLSVSQFLPSATSFDLVVFDEASQIRSEDAVGAIYRGRQLLVCGDHKQLPPTSFFESAMSEEFDEDHPDADQEFEPLQSVLEDCLALGMREAWLRWHYRSRHEALIAFSNGQFYEWRLVTFPSPMETSPDLGIAFVHVSDGVYDRGGKRDNPREAELVADLVFEHFERRPAKSLGVVAFSLAQMERIDDELEQRRRERPEMEPYFAGRGMESFFVKNLENVQGDERDVIIFSVGYGRDATGRLTMSFGPLNQAGGERRLNVAITRAREKVSLVSSIRAADMDLTATQAPGVKMLHRYLDYAERGRDALEFSPPPGAGEVESALEQDVAQAIREMAYGVHSQVGCSGFRIDLGVVDPARPGQFILGVECDGATYHSSYVARDKDRLRQEVLEDLGWRIHRVWSPDWWRRRDAEVERLRQAIEHARSACGNPGHTPASPAHGRMQATPADPPVTVKMLPLPPHNLDPQWLRWTTPYRVARPRAPGGLQSAFHLPESRSKQVQLVAEIVAAEGPMHDDLVARRLAGAWGVRRVGSRIRATADDAIAGAIRKGHATREGEFLWPVAQEFRLSVRIPVPGDPETVRQVGHVSPSEIALAMRHLVRDGVGISPDALVTEVARVFGFARTGSHIRQRLQRVLGHLLKKGYLVQEGDLLHIPRTPA